MRKISSILIALLFVLMVVGCGKSTFTVTFESNGGSAVLAIEDVLDASMIDEPTAPTKSGFDFAGWFKESALTNAWDFEVDKVSSDITLYAKWTVAEPTDQNLVDAAYTWLSLGDLSALTNGSARIIMPTSKDDVSILWSIDKLQYIAANGLISQPAFEDGNQTVTLTATITLGAVSRTKVFTATVIALPSLEETEPLINETFEAYADGNIVTQTGIWGPVSGKSGNSEFTVVGTISGMSIPKGSNALKIQALLELQIEAPIVHAYDLVVIEVDLMQSASSNGSSINIQSSSSSPVVGFGLDGAGLFYRTDNGTLMTTPIEVNTWYTMRVEVNLANKTIEVFYYADGQLMALTPGPVTYAGTTSLQSLFIRSGSSTTTSLREPAYITNIVANRIEAMPRPDEIVKLGDVSGITPTVNVEFGTTFTPEVPMIYNFYGSQRLLVAETEYTLAVTNPVDVNTAGEYEVFYVFTNVADANDVVRVTQSVIVYSPAEPNTISSVNTTYGLYPEYTVEVTVVAVQPSGDLFVYLSNNETENAETIKTGTAYTITTSITVIEDISVEMYTYIHTIVVLNGDSNVVSHLISKQALVEIATAQEFYDALHLSETIQLNSYFLVTTDIDFTGYIWATPAVLTDFVSTFDGGGHVLSNLNLDKTSKGGIFSDIENATLKNIVFDNVHTTSTTSTSALLVGESRGVSILDNIVIMNSSSIGNGDYGAFVVGRVRSGSLTMSNIAIISSVVESKKDYAGGLVAGMDVGTTISFSDIYLNDFTVLEATEDTGQMAGLIIGRIQGNVTMDRIVAIDIFVKGIKNIGGLIGKSDEVGTTVVLTDIFVSGSVERLDLANNNYGTIAGNYSDQTPTLVNVWASGFADVGTLGLDVTPENKIEFLLVQNESWWTSNISNILGSNIWTVDATGVPLLVNANDAQKPNIEVTVIYNIIDGEVLQIKQDSLFTHETPTVDGYTFIGWYMDELLTTPLAPGYLVTVSVTLYGQYETAPASTVNFITNIEGLFDDNQSVNYGELATEPIVDDQMIDSVMKEVTGWMLDDVPFDFSTPIVGNITLVAVWEIKSYEVTFNGADAVTVIYGELVTQPVDPVSIFAELTFNAWTLADVTYDFNTPVTASINLISSFNAPVGNISIGTIDEFYYMATHDYDYDFVLSTDLDFTSFTWDSNGGNFTGTFDGQNHTLTGINMNVGDRAGIFTYFSGTFENVVIEDAVIVSTGRAGVIAGEIDAETAVVTNVHFVNVSVTGASDNGVGAITGVIKDGAGGLTASIISVIGSTFTNNNKNVGALVGYVRGSGATSISDVYINDITIIGQSDQVGGIAGYVKNPLSFSLTNVVMDGVDITQNGSGGYAASVVGRIDTSTVIDIQNLIVINDTITAVKYTNTITGRYDTVAATSFTMTNVYSGTTVINVTAAGQGALVIIDPLTLLNAAWFGTNMPTITTPNWDLSSDIPKLTNSPTIS